MGLIFQTATSLSLALGKGAGQETAMTRVWLPDPNIRACWEGFHRNTGPLAGATINLLDVSDAPGEKTQGIIWLLIHQDTLYAYEMDKWPGSVVHCFIMWNALNPNNHGYLSPCKYWVRVFPISPDNRHIFTLLCLCGDEHRSGHSVTRSVNQLILKFSWGIQGQRRREFKKKKKFLAGRAEEPFQDVFPSHLPDIERRGYNKVSQSLWSTNLALALSSRSQPFLSAPSIARNEHFGWKWSIS